ncbi:S8 family serine peptidase [Marivirga sp. S37H4]|uniref:S8 family serine peptidase n=1 Tax=Marivirga aurantiaca TaxID=2802615 RepID=A0A935C813_9BACT|nr:S8 family serine peptidase [Marivirga aurantiaca]MBK6264687.1 S8 family serine peptidase [Marivirga aurantiaca]
MKRILTVLVAMTILWSCSKDEENLKVEEQLVDVQQTTEIIPKEKIDEFIINSLKKNNEFNWSEVNDVMLWSALVHADSILTVGYTASGQANINERMTSINVQDPEWIKSRDEVFDETASVLSRKYNKSVEVDDLPSFTHEVLPFVEMKASDLEVINRLRSLENVRYIEPLGYEVDFQTYGSGERYSDSGCSNSPDFGLASDNYSTISPNAKMSWNYPGMGIDQAWNYSTGQGITVGLIDTGLSPDQIKLGNEFNSGSSANRTVERFGFHATGMWWWKAIDGPDDQCGHGTAMAGVIAAPRSTSGSSVGVAYNANLIGVRGTGDVVVNSGNEKTGVSDALIYLGNRNDVKIISMSIGDVFHNSKVADAIRYAHGKGKLIFAAAGTSTSFTNWFGVIFPATMNETVAVTGVKEGQYVRCDVCHSGDKVDFTVVMEKAGTNAHPLSLAMSGSDPSTVGGSSVATATAAGIAALVWSKNPGWNRDQVLNKLKQSADFYPNRNSSFGYGNLNALTAVQ